MSGGPLIGATAGAGLGLYQSYAQAHAARGALSSLYNSTQTTINQAASQAADERAKQTAAAERILGRVRVAAGETGNTLDSTSQQTMIDAGKNRATINTNLGGIVTRAQTGYEAQANQIRSQVSNPIVSALTTGLQGLLSGFAVEGGLAQIAGDPAVPATSQLDPIWANYGGDPVP